MKRLILILFIFIIAIPIYSGVFPAYDFTLYKTVQDSIAIINGERFGFDFSGYGYLGDSMTSGIYLRLGIQTPYKTILDIVGKSLSLLSSGMGEELIAPLEPENSDALNAEDINKDYLQRIRMNKDYKVSFTIGPSFRKFISDKAVWYGGFGLASTIENTTKDTDNKAILLNDFEVKMALDFDSGFRVDLQKRFSMRIGANMNIGLFTYGSTSSYLEDGTRVDFENYFNADMFPPIGERKNMQCIGYVSLATTFKPRIVEKYSYIISSTELGQGNTILLQ